MDFSGLEYTGKVCLLLLDMAPIPTRRSFLKVGLIGALTLTAVGGIYRVAQNRTPSAPGLPLDEATNMVLSAIAAAMLKTTVPSASTHVINEQIARVHGVIAALPLRTQKEIAELLSLLAFGPTRRFLVGIPHDWAEATSEEVAAFLQRWRNHRFSLLQSAYHALHDLMMSAWYIEESYWPLIGYPGPPPLG